MESIDPDPGMVYLNMTCFQTSHDAVSAHGNRETLVFNL